MPTYSMKKTAQAYTCTRCVRLQYLSKRIKFFTFGMLLILLCTNSSCKGAKDEL